MRGEHSPATAYCVAEIAQGRTGAVGVEWW